ncbi:Flp pilus assembly protein TadG [Duganella sp. 1411]|uniref:TadE/TadG family type IV pilus assembly protein n=1 Tax=Duganella sp. 1411 TaxID=2806572 RepID=UPI001AE66121|nr:TadE/TadG family type IV pilus assembly protein [Duganella sp. 1411]MBP1204823.1 Flp pilus assembly protein TadG [Duganella sp. 1411]
MNHRINLPAPTCRRGARRQHGIAAVELALILPVLVLMLIFPLYLGRVYWHYTVIQHAAHDAARYLSKAPDTEMSNATRAVAVASVADTIIAMELAELAPGAYPYVAQVNCDSGPCVGYSRPSKVRVSIQLLVEDIFFPGYLSLTIPLTVDVSYPYMGR